jgi:hypothetical protein
MTFMDLKMIVLDAHEARSRAGRALAEHFPEGSTITVRVDDADTKWYVEEIDFDRLEIKARREICGEVPIRASFGVSDLVGLGKNG